MGRRLNPKTRLKRKHSRRCREDRISSLPDSLLQHILSFVSTRDAVRTSILSIRWRNVWTLVPCLDLESRFYVEDDFLDAMDKLLNVRGNSYLQKLILQTYTQEDVSSHLVAWMDRAVMCKIEHIEIMCHVDHEEDEDEELYLYEMPQCLWVCNTLVVLKLCTVILTIPELVSLCSLKIMHLEEVVFINPSDLAFQRLILGCPVLEKLEIIRTEQICRRSKGNLKVLSIFSQTLKELRIENLNLDRRVGYGMVIDTPHLEYLSLLDLQSENFVIRNLNSFKAYINVTFNESLCYGLRAVVSQKRSNIDRFFVDISKVKSLTTYSRSFKILFAYKLEATPPQFHNLFHLVVTVQNNDWEMLPVILECCPNLKSFIMTFWGKVESNPFRLSLSTPQCMLTSLESITLENAMTGDEGEMDLIKHFLENSGVLKEMKLNLSRELSIERDTLIFQEIYKFPRRSRTCRLHIE